MIFYEQGDMFAKEYDAYVNTVNCVGVMGKGLAARFKARYPENYDYYMGMCAQGKVKPGKMLIMYDQMSETWIVNFPTKMHWRNPSQLEWIDKGLKNLKKKINKHMWQSIAIPALGCGLGGLDWREVKPLIAKRLKKCKGIDIYVYEGHVFEEKHKHHQGIDWEQYLDDSNEKEKEKIDRMIEEDRTVYEPEHQI